MTQVAPFEQIYGPLEVWISPVATAFTAINVTPSGAWAKLGTSGKNSYTEDGVAVEHAQTTHKFTPVGSTAPTKVWRSAEGWACEIELADISAETYAKVMNNAAITNVAGPPGHKAFPVLQGADVALFALLLRGDFSPGGDGFKSQYEVYSAYQAGEPKPVFKKDVIVGLRVKFDAIKDASGNFAIWRIQYA